VGTRPLMATESTEEHGKIKSINAEKTGVPKLCYGCGDFDYMP
jgi:hypothetical protein